MKERTYKFPFFSPEQKKPKTTADSELRAKASSLKLNKLQNEHDMNFASHVNHVLEQLDSLKGILEDCQYICDYAIDNSTKLDSEAEETKDNIDESIKYVDRFMKRLYEKLKEVKERIAVNHTNIVDVESDFKEFKILLKYKYNFTDNEINMIFVFDSLILYALRTDLAVIRFNICTLIIMQKDTFTYFEKDFFDQFLLAYSELLFDRNLMTFDSFKQIPVVQKEVYCFLDGKERFVNDITPDTRLTSAVEDEFGGIYIFNFLPKQQGKASLGFIIQICYPNEEKRMIFVKQFFNNSWMLRNSSIDDTKDFESTITNSG